MDKRADELLHQLWSKAVGKEGYDKDQWKELAALIESAVYSNGKIADPDLLQLLRTSQAIADEIFRGVKFDHSGGKCYYDGDLAVLRQAADSVLKRAEKFKKDLEVK